MPYIMHSYTFQCRRCGVHETRSLNDEDYLKGEITANEVSSDFTFSASLDLSKVTGKNAFDSYISSGQINQVSGDLCDDCLVSLSKWLRNE